MHLGDMAAQVHHVDGAFHQAHLGQAILEFLQEHPRFAAGHNQPVQAVLAHRLLDSIHARLETGKGLDAHIGRAAVGLKIAF